jgi:hypothetical protein
MASEVPRQGGQDQLFLDRVSSSPSSTDFARHRIDGGLIDAASWLIRAKCSAIYLPAGLAGGTDAEKGLRRSLQPAERADLTSSKADVQAKAGRSPAAPVFH